MTRVQGFALGAYVVLLYLALGPPLNDGTFNPWVLVFAHVVLGLGVARWWVLAVPVVVTVAGVYLATDDFGLLALFGGPVCVLLTAAGRGLAYTPPKFRVGTAAVCAALIALALVGDAVEELREGPPLPAAVQRQLPSQNSLLVLCPWEGGREAAKAHASVDALVRELEARPNHTLSYTFHWAHEGPDDQEITVRELAEVTLDDLEHGDARGSCAPETQARLREAL